jgi:hypothetical protein
MSAAATAAGYLYASGRLRGRAQREQEHHDDKPAANHERPAQSARPRIERPRKEVRVAALPEAGEPRIASDRPRRTPTIQYRTRRWRPGEDSQ